MVNVIITLAIIAGASFGIWFLVKKFKKDWNPYVSLISALVSAFKNFLSAIDKNPEEYSKLEIAIELLDKGLIKTKELLGQKDVIENMPIDKQLTYVADVMKAFIYAEVPKLGLEITAETKGIVDTVLNLLSFFIAPLFSKKEN